MKIRFDKFKILELSTNKFKEFNFSDSVNIIEAENTKGKSSLMKSLMFCLGFNVKEWAISFLPENFIFILNFNINEGKHTVIRHKNIFILDNKYFSNESSYKEIINELLGIEIKLTNKNDTIRTLPYPTDLFLFSYVDQDSSYTNSCFNYNHKNIGMYKKDELLRLYKYYIKIENEKLDNLMNQKTKYDSENSKLSNKNESLENILKEIELVMDDVIPITKNEFKEVINNFEKRITEIMSAKNKIENEKYFKIKTLKEYDMEVMNLENIFSELENKKTDLICKFCHSEILNNNFTETYKKELNKNYIISLYTEYKEKIIRTNEDINKLNEKLEELSTELDIINKKHFNVTTEFDINMILEANANMKLQEKLNKEIEVISDKINSNNKNIKILSKQINAERKLLDNRSNQVKKQYEDIIDEVSSIFKNTNSENFKENFLNFKIKDTGAQKNILQIELYYIYFYLLTKYSRISFPIVWDSIIKDAFDGNNDKYLNEFVNNKLLKLDTQIIFSNIPRSNKDVKIEKNDSYNYIRLDNRLLCSEDNGKQEKDLLNEIFKIISGKK